MNVFWSIGIYPHQIPNAASKYLSGHLYSSLFGMENHKWCRGNLANPKSEAVAVVVVVMNSEPLRQVSD
ncbi:hypothetical protein CAEBREN_19047 [Caenorhabditis brenneri]|uniref:Uncharacterized protein n=1 Tax=Caenorhabditis brenneri TaxID=135651 RepID=G0MBL8_CAEBE|nr:hypothetical protein CAEBREN_19047 [Caenorhabditis brenneri]